MPQATDIENVLADRLWVLIEAQPTITAMLVPANKDKGTAQGWLRKMLSTLNAPADQRRLEISFGRFRNSLYTLREGFPAEDDDFTVADQDDFNVRRVHEAVITYREPLRADPGANPIKEAIEQTIFLAGPTLGLPALVDSVGELTGETREMAPAERRGAMRVTTFRLPITTTQSALALITETP